MEGWTYLFTYGYSGEVWGRGSSRKIIDKKTGRVISSYEVSNQERPASKTTVSSSPALACGK